MRDSKGRFKKGEIGFWAGKKRPNIKGNPNIVKYGKDNILSHLKFVGAAHARWKGGKPLCKNCGKNLTRYQAQFCIPCLALVRVEEKSPHWSGEQVGYRGLHLWVQRKLGKPDACVFCNKSGLKGRQIHWANKSGSYKRLTSDWLRLCVPCHKKYDHA